MFLVAVSKMIGLLTFDDRVRTQIPLQSVRDESHKQELRATLTNARNGRWGGTMMYTALLEALNSLNRCDKSVETWIVALTDGQSGDNDGMIRNALRDSSDSRRRLGSGFSFAQDGDLSLPSC